MQLHLLRFLEVNARETIRKNFINPVHYVYYACFARISDGWEGLGKEKGNDDVLDLPIRSIVKDGERSWVMDLPGNARIINKVIFMHQKVKGDKKAEVILWGRK